MELAQTERSETAQSAGPTQSRQSANAGNAERIASIVLGSGLITFGLIRRSRAGWSLAATGATLLYRGSGAIAPSIARSASTALPTPTDAEAISG